MLRLIKILVLQLAVVIFMEGELCFALEPCEALAPIEKVKWSPNYGSVIELKDGRLLWTWGSGGTKDPLLYGNHSTDGGKTWSDPVPLVHDNGEPVHGRFNTSLVRMKSGKLGQAFQTTGHLFFQVSSNEGKSWSPAVMVHPEGQHVAFTNDRAIVLESGRIVLPVYTILNGPTLPERKSHVQRFGATFDVTTGAMAYCYAIFSDDEGKTWAQSENVVFVALEKGARGIYSSEEPSIVELSDGKLLMHIRTSLGRTYRSISTDHGLTWGETSPTPLVGPPAPCGLYRIPKSNDVLAIWTQVSSYELMQGLYRHRLTCAVSSDGGQTWQHFRNLESLDDTAQVAESEPAVVLFGKGSQPLDRVRYHRAPGFLRASYPSCMFVDGTAVITYGLSTLGDKETISRTYGMNYDEVVRKLGFGPTARGNKVRVLPIEWFYGK